MPKQMYSIQHAVAEIFADGVGFGNCYENKDYCMLNTFVTRMMLYKKQAEMTEDMRDFIDSISKKSWADIRDSNNALFGMFNNES